MTTRLQWFSVTPMREKDIETVHRRFLAEKYSDERGYGVILQEARRSRLRGAYVEKAMIKEFIVDPFGKRTVFEIPRYMSVGFLLTSEYPGLEIVNSPRSIGRFLSFLGDCLENRVAIEPIAFGLVAIQAALKGHTEKVVLQAVSLKDIALSGTVSADADISGTDDVAEFVSQLTGRRRYDYSGARFCVESKGTQYRVEVNSNGKVKVIAGDASEFARLFRIVMGSVHGKPAPE